MWASDQGFECVLTIADPRFPDKKLGWLDDDGDIDHLRVEAEVRRLEQDTRSGQTHLGRMSVGRREKKTLTPYLIM